MLVINMQLDDYEFNDLQCSKQGLIGKEYRV